MRVLHRLLSVGHGLTVHALPRHERSLAHIHWHSEYNAESWVDTCPGRAIALRVRPTLVYSQLRAKTLFPQHHYNGIRANALSNCHRLPDISGLLYDLTAFPIHLYFKTVFYTLKEQA